MICWVTILNFWWLAPSSPLFSIRISFHLSTRATPDSICLIKCILFFKQNIWWECYLYGTRAHRHTRPFVELKNIQSTYKKHRPFDVTQHVSPCDRALFNLVWFFPWQTARPTPWTRYLHTKPKLCEFILECGLTRAAVRDLDISRTANLRWTRDRYRQMQL